MASSSTVFPFFVRRQNGCCYFHILPLVYLVDVAIGMSDALICVGDVTIGMADVLVGVVDVVIGVVDSLSMLSLM